jgi:hypothetical protein
MTEDLKSVEHKNTVTITDAGACKKKVAIEVPEEAVHGALDGQQGAAQGRDGARIPQGQGPDKAA